ncbi:MAG: GNAT family N-acetyltransferase [Candidatus Paceibacterota bacterium]
MHEVKGPLPIYESRHIGKFQAKDGTNFNIVEGLDKELVRQLKEKSLDESDAAIQTYTSDKQRFGEGSYEEWYGKERTPFALVEGKMGTLAALAWFGPKPIGRKSLRYLSAEELKEESRQEKSDWHTIVYRSYAPFRGKGIMTPFLKDVVSVYRARYPRARLWAGISGGNEASAALAAKLGFVKADEYTDAKTNWSAMILNN